MLQFANLLFPQDFWQSLHPGDSVTHSLQELKRTSLSSVTDENLKLTFQFYTVSHANCFENNVLHSKVQKYAIYDRQENGKTLTRTVCYGEQSLMVKLFASLWFQSRSNCLAHYFFISSFRSFRCHFLVAERLCHRLSHHFPSSPRSYHYDLCVKFQKKRCILSFDSKIYASPLFKFLLCPDSKSLR